MRRIYTCATCGGPVTKNATTGLGKWKCVNNRCVSPAISTNKAGAMNSWVDASNRKGEASPIRTGQSPHCKVRVRMAA